MLIFAHRGASGYQVENTLAAMAKALELGAKAIELDVHNVEGELVVFHDRRLDNKSSGTGVIHTVTKDYLAGINVKGEPIPTLWQILELIAGRCTVNIELKGINTVQPLVDLYPKVLSELGFTEDQLLISSFNHPYLSDIKRALPQALVAPLLASIPLDGATVVSQLRAYSLHLDVSFISQALVDDAHQRGAKVYVYTVDHSDDIHALKQMGVDGIFSNYPDRAMEALTQTPSLNYQGYFE
ncbi:MULTISPECIES: glycerophosphodiester phosphodiesterase [Shewanella]|uniref:Glycerophosphodiester phosphodiesterase n=1 Tax=Shewanella putrefaciens TaxID=24 RepID=A0ABX8XA30_SHEPU|nr:MULTISPECIES: glycerophosphodiester phosphodiesterase family protein [Shewanella]AVV85232.1 glycerophosphoryl diester phosphodiesterase [Shewanella putrefaciens]MCK7630786.1 glycerophosphodiester phosphodiesterase [Shewanella sp. JNE9-1]MCK7635329.1 glycerophosphodiester phosphodiesterase [Shewanella sp. JNE17]MCK7645984.1 glycerophosphodiester phosphodiesterase [Shewanella sp. JNE3-1]MCK7650610.1 glycerophosphodiester phosphodiesterase [Shewanella sp. JNE8]